MRVKMITRILGKKIRKVLDSMSIDTEQLQEIRLRVGKPLIVKWNNEEQLLQYVVDKQDVDETLEYVSNYSRYAFENEIKQGFITVEGGHRVGMTGHVQVEDGEVKTITYVTSLNIRISHEILGCSDNIFKYLVDGKQAYNVLIISPPGCGKTTLLRDLVRQISNGNAWMKGNTVGVVDERSEIGGAYLGVAQNDLGIRTDLLDCCPKSKGMLMLVRTMSPRVIAVDEIGSEEDIHALEYAMHCGTKLIATVHGKSLEEIKSKPIFNHLINERHFERYVVLGNERRVGQIIGLYDKDGKLLYEEKTNAEIIG